ncbi:hypothetical protein MLD38_010384 [Melastoma candidum]|uniref:Uncharacterized protein n=2 Tax=Melastoma candidum TaxID=119954 RepID=A0ACB9QZ24_9MYRT|nr:hypothetical protein MLD38_010384 [Melastoma candidum]
MRRRGRQGMRPRQISYGNDMILSDGKDASQEFVRRSRFHWVNRRPGFEVSAPWKGEEEGLFQRPKVFEHGRDVEDEDMFKRPKKFKRGHHDEDDDDKDEMFKRPPKKFRHHDDEDDVFKRPKKFDHDDEFRPLETVSKVKHEDDDLVFRMPRKFDHWDDDHDNDWHREKKHHHRRFGHHHHKHHHDVDDDNKGGFFSNMRKLFDDLF